MTKYFSREEINQIINLYESKETISYISKKFNSHRAKIKKILSNNNIITRSNSESLKLSFKFSFQEMNKYKAFLLGLIFGDGSISNRNDYVSITSIDLDLLKKSQFIIGEKFKIKDKKDSNCYYGIAYSHKLCEELFNIFGIKNNKSAKLIFPNISDDLIPSFVSGYTATDGCISTTYSKNNLILIVSYTSCSKYFLEDLNKYVCNKINIPPRNVRERKFKPNDGHLGKQPLYTLAFSCSNAEKICKYMFQDNDVNLRSDRKHLVYCNYMKEKYNIIV